MKQFRENDEINFQSVSLCTFIVNYGFGGGAPVRDLIPSWIKGIRGV